MTLSRPLVLALLAFASVGSGLIVSIVGPTVPALAGRLHVGESALGVVFTANFLTGAAATALSGRLFDRFGPRLLTPFGLLALALGALAEGIAGSPAALTLAAVVAGIGVGVTNVCVGAAAAVLYPERRGATLNILNASFGTGAFAAPLLAELCLTRLHGYTLAYVVVALVLAVPVVPLLCGLPGARRGARGDQGAGSPPPAPPLRALLRKRRLWAPITIGALYLGAEIGFGGWIVTIVSRSARLDPAGAAPLASVFWLALALGGVPTALLLRRGVAPVRIITLGAVGVVGGAVLLLAVGHSLPPAAAACALIGLAFSPIFPLAQALAVGVAAEDGAGAEGGALALMLVASGVGAAIVPPVQGLLLRGGLIPAIAPTLLCAVGIAAISYRLSRARLAPRG